MQHKKTLKTEINMALGGNVHWCISSAFLTPTVSGRQKNLTMSESTKRLCKENS